MAGIGQAMVGPQSAAPQPGMTQPQGQQSDPGGDDQESNVTPEEQAAYTQFVENGMKLIYGAGDEPKVEDTVLASLKATDDPVQNLGVTTASIVAGLIENAAQAGHKVDPDIAYQGGVELLEQLADVAEAAKIHDYSDKEMEAAMYRAMDQVVKQNPGGIVDQAGSAQEFQQLVQDDKDGTLAQKMPAVAAAIGKAG